MVHVLLHVSVVFTDRLALTRVLYFILQHPHSLGARSCHFSTPSQRVRLCSFYILNIWQSSCCNPDYNNRYGVNSFRWLVTTLFIILRCSGLIWTTGENKIVSWQISVGAPFIKSDFLIVQSENGSNISRVHHECTLCCPGNLAYLPSFHSSPFSHLGPLNQNTNRDWQVHFKPMASANA